MTREEREAEAREILGMRGMERKVRLYADWAEGIERDAVDEERKALREIVEKKACGNRCADTILAALDARSKP